MAAHPVKSSARMKTLLLFLALLSCAVWRLAADCLDGTYKHDGRDCCRCAAGQRVEEHCTENLGYGKCEPCPEETYSSEPNSEKTCERCRSCSQPNAGLEEAERCTPGRDRKCRCQTDHYCPSGTENCRVCHTCDKCGAEGIKVECKGNNNTICNEIIEGGNGLGIILGVVFAVVIISAICLGLFFWWKRRRNAQQTINLQKSNEADVEAPLRDIYPHLPEIAEVIGWRDMRDLAMRCSIANTQIESCQLNHPQDAQEQTLELLKIWVEREGPNAGKTLVGRLREMKKNAKAESVRDILNG